MYKTLLITFTAIMVFSINDSHAQLSMSAGTTDLSLRVGAGFPKTEKFSAYDKFTATTPAIGFSFETGLWNFGLSAGGEFNYAKYQNDTKTKDMSVLMGIVFLKYYPPLVFNKIATYARLDLLPIGVFKISPASSSSSGAKSIYGIYAGANYQFADKLGVFAELGSGYTTFNTGLSWRIAE